MRILLRVVVCLLACTSLARAQQSSPPVLPSNLYTTLPSGSGSGSTPFAFSSYGGVDNDSTDNCANGSIAAFTAAVNAYSGPGRPVAIIGPTAPTTKQTYKLATNANSCTFAFTRVGGVIVHLVAWLDCAQTSQSCMQFGPTGQGSEVNGEIYTLDGGGGFLDGSHLTLAGIYAEPGINQINISNIQFGVASIPGFGASTTMGNCTNYAAYFDQPIADGFVDHTIVNVASSDSTHGGCGYANPGGGGPGQGTNTFYFESNVISTGGNVGGGTQCGSTGIIDGGSLGMIHNNNIYGLGIPVRIQGVGHTGAGNQIDNANCTGPAGVGAAFQAGATSSSTAVGPITLTGNKVQVLAQHSTGFFAIAGDSTASVYHVTLKDNMNTGSGNGSVGSTGNLITSGLSCTVDTVTRNLCTAGGNIGLLVPGPTGSTQTGWWNALGEVASLFVSAQTANLGSTLLLTSPVSRTYIASCAVTLTTAAGTSSTLPSCIVNYTDSVTGAATTQTITVTNATNVVGATQSGYAQINVNSGNAINITTTGYLSNPGAAMQYAVTGFLYTY